jgi:hypothetical protein
MTSTTRIQRKYDHRLRELVRSTGDIDYVIQRGVPRSTARGWLASTRAEVVTLDIVDMDTLRLQQEVLALQSRVDRLVALLRLLVIALKMPRFSLASVRLPEGTTKLTLLRAIERSCSVLPLRVILRILRLSHSRYHSWKREKECGLDDMPSCPRFSSQQLTPAECHTIQEMVTSEEYRHVPTETLCWSSEFYVITSTLKREHLYQQLSSAKVAGPPQRPRVSHARSGENSRGKLQNVVANSTADYFDLTGSKEHPNLIVICEIREKISK